MRPPETTALARKVAAKLKRTGWLLQADRELPSVATLVAGEAIAGSWWGHAAGNQIYWVLEALEADPDVLSVKLVKGKVTLVERRLWPSLLAVATATAPWQSHGLSDSERALLRRTRRAGCLGLEALARWSHADKPGVAARELERRLLVYSDEVHTDAGHHVKQLQSWPHLMAARGLDAKLPDVETAKGELERAFAGHGKLLPWQRSVAKGRR